MNFGEQLAAVQARHASMLCVGLDPEPARFPPPWRNDAARIFDFCAAIVEATHDLVCAFKPQIAYFADHAPMKERKAPMLAKRWRATAPR